MCLLVCVYIHEQVFGLVSGLQFDLWLLFQFLSKTVLGMLEILSIFDILCFCS